MSNGCVGTMSTLGFVTKDMNLAMDLHIAYWFAARRDQCKMIPDVPSFEWVLMQNQGDREKLLTEVKTTLTTYFQELTEQVEVLTSSTTESGNPDDGKFTMLVGVKCVTPDGKEYDLQRAVLVSGQTYELIKKGRGI